MKIKYSDTAREISVASRIVPRPSKFKLFLSWVSLPYAT